VRDGIHDLGISEFELTNDDDLGYPTPPVPLALPSVPHAR
jgi:hypothetical protein